MIALLFNQITCVIGVALCIEQFENTGYYYSLIAAFILLTCMFSNCITITKFLFINL